MSLTCGMLNSEFIFQFPGDWQQADGGSTPGDPKEARQSNGAS